MTTAAQSAYQFYLLAGKPITELIHNSHIKALSGLLFLSKSKSYNKKNDLYL